MAIAKIPENEASRLEALRRYDILDTLEDQAYDDLTRIAASITGSPIALISLVDQDRLWFKSKVGLRASQMPREHTFCSHAIVSPGVGRGDAFVVGDTLQDDRFVDNMVVVNDPRIRFYAGAMLMTPDHYPLGTLCVLDREPRRMDDSQLAALNALGRQVVTQLELRRSASSLKEALSTVEERTGQLEAAERKYRSIFENSTEGIFHISFAGGIVFANQAMAHMLGYDGAEDLRRGVTDVGRDLHLDASLHEEILAALQRNGIVSQVEFQARRKDGEPIWASLTARVVPDPSGGAGFYEGTMRDVTKRKQAEIALKKAQSDLVRTARQAGMAEIATNVLHNVGNVLTSVNTSAHMLRSKVQGLKSQGDGLMQAHQLLKKENGGRPAVDGAKLDMLASYLDMLSQHASAEQRDMAAELDELSGNIQHISNIIATQQTHAGAVRLVEPTLVADLVEDAIRIKSERLTLRKVEVVRKFADVPPLMLDRARMLQVLINLIGNAKDALENVEEGARRITLSIDVADKPEAGDPAANGGAKTLRIRIQDAGEGIPAENLTRIFSFGFTTRPKGHGFGLHGSAIAAMEMGGSLTAHSDGPGTGATFTLEVPMQAA